MKVDKMLLRQLTNEAFAKWRNILCPTETKKTKDGVKDVFVLVKQVKENNKK